MQPESKRPWHELHPLLSQVDINSRIDEMGKSAAIRYKDEKPIFLVVDDGARQFADKFLQSAHISGLEFDTASITIKSMNGRDSEKLEVVKGYEGPERTNRKIIILEDIVDTGKTIDFLLETLAPFGPTILEAIVLFAKTERREKDVADKIADVGFNVFGFVVGFNIDYDNLYRMIDGLWLVKFWPKDLKEWWRYFLPKKPRRLTSPI